MVVEPAAGEEPATAGRKLPATIGPTLPIPMGGTGRGPPGSAGLDIVGYSGVTGRGGAGMSGILMLDRGGGSGAPASMRWAARIWMSILMRSFCHTPFL